ncbi:MAG: hypothetical protein P1U68_16010 [Verrucomicrobiales bacterium]|nr:hypothetical protein [Verrucomicrobiales bacterium]
MKRSILIIPCFAALFLASCGGDTTTETQSVDASASQSFDGIFLEASPEGAIPVVAARAKATPGETLTVSGKVAGVMNPFTEGFASVVLSDEKLETCDLIPGDSCSTPWDACCVDNDDITEQLMTIQVVGEDGMPVAESLKGVKGLKEMDSLVVTGTVNEASNADNLILDVTGLFQN